MEKERPKGGERERARAIFGCFNSGFCVWHTVSTGKNSY